MHINVKGVMAQNFVVGTSEARQFVPADRAPGPVDQCLQQRSLSRRKIEGDVAHREASRLGVESQRAYSYRCLQRLLTAAMQCFQARFEFDEFERMRQTVVCTRIQAQRTVERTVGAGEQDRHHFFALSKTSDKAQAIRAQQLEVGDDDIEGIQSQQLLSGEGIPASFDIDPRIVQGLGQ